MANFNFNKVILGGRLTADPELKHTQSGVANCRFTIAVDRSFTKQGEERQADFVDCVAWRQQAVFISNYFRRGSMIAIQGSIQTRNWEDKNGSKRKSTEIVVSQANFCGSKSENNTGASQNSAPYQPATSFATADEGDFKEIPEDDLPF